MVEIMVETIFVSLSGCDERRATILFSFFKSVSTQCDVIRLMAKTQPSIGPDLSKRLNAVLSLYGDLAQHRNGIIHYPFGWDTDLDTATIYKMRRTRSGPEVWVKEPTGDEAVYAVAEQIEGLFQQTIKLQHDITEALSGASLRRLQQLSPDQIQVPLTVNQLTNLLPPEGQ